MTVSLGTGVDIGNIVTSTVNPVTGVISFSVGENDLHLTYAPGRQFAALGDSITVNNTAGTNNLRAAGFMSHAVALSLGKILFSNAYNFGVNGDTSVQALARLPSAIAANPDYCVVLVGTNDPYNSIAFADTVAACTAIYGGLLSAGITPVIVPLLPRSKDNASGAIAAADRAKMARIAAWQVQYAASTKGCVLADPSGNLLDYSLNNGDPIGVNTGSVLGVTADGLHPNQRGAFWIGKAIADAVSGLLPDASLSRNPGAAYDATNNPAGNLLANAFMAGTAGTNGTGSTGQVATSWQAKRNIGSTLAIASSKTTKAVANGTTYAQQQMALTAPAGAAAEELLFYQTVTTGITFGTDSMYAEMEVDISGVTPGSLVYVGMVIFDGATYTYHNQYQTSGYAPDQSFSAVLRTPVITPPADKTYVQPQLIVRIDGTVASAGVTIKCGRAGLYKV